MLGRSLLRIDLLTEIDGVSASEVFSTAKQFNIDGLSVPVISPATMLKNKIAASRPKDLPDILELQALIANSN